MTPSNEEIKAAVDKVSFSGLLASMKMRMDVYNRPYRVGAQYLTEPVVALHWTAPDRETGLPREFIAEDTVFDTDRDHLDQMLRELIKFAVVHEFEEGYLLDGKRVLDPHQGK